MRAKLDPCFYGAFEKVKSSVTEKQAQCIVHNFSDTELVCVKCGITHDAFLNFNNKIQKETCDMVLESEA